jgi:hypothetical protein
MGMWMGMGIWMGVWICHDYAMEDGDGWMDDIGS